MFPANSAVNIQEGHVGLEPGGGTTAANQPVAAIRTAGADNLHSSGALRGLAYACEVDWSGGVALRRCRLARAAIERLRAARCLEAENARLGRPDQERVWNTARRERESARADTMILSINVHKDLAVQHVQHLVLVDVEVQRRCLALQHVVLKEHQRAGRLLRARLPRMDAAAVEPEALALPVVTNDRDCRAHVIPPCDRFAHVLSAHGVPLWE